LLKPPGDPRGEAGRRGKTFVIASNLVKRSARQASLRPEIVERPKSEGQHGRTFGLHALGALQPFKLLP
jgi:hypothetical protein